MNNQFKTTSSVPTLNLTAPILEEHGMEALTEIFESLADTSEQEYDKLVSEVNQLLTINSK